MYYIDQDDDADFDDDDDDDDDGGATDKTEKLNLKIEKNKNVLLFFLYIKRVLFTLLVFNIFRI